MDDKFEEDFLKWFSYQTIYSGFGEFFSDSDTLPHFSFLTQLEITKQEIKPSTLDIIKYLENTDRGIDLGHGIHAYYQFQDILPITFNKVGETFQNRHYCYYESLNYLRESLVCWIDKNVLAAITLMRPFLELSLFHLYWYIKCEDENYDKYYSWLNGEKGKPSFKDIFETVFDKLSSEKGINLERLDALKVGLDNIYKYLCSYNHTPKIDESLYGKGTGKGKTTLDSFFTYQFNTTMILRDLVYLYSMVYPMALYPVDIYRRFGFSAPVGAYFDHQNFLILEKFIGTNNIEKLKNQLKDNDRVKSLLDFYNSRPIISDEEIKNDWIELQKLSNSKANAGSLGEMIAKHKAQHRALGWAMNYMLEFEEEQEISDELLAKVEKKLKDW